MENRPRKPPRQSVEEKMLLKRERDQKHAQTWSDQVQYYDRNDKNNTRHDSWTSPRYYENNNHLIHQVQEAKNKKELLEKRRERLRKLVMEDEKSWGVELVMTQRDKYLEKKNEVSVDVLKAINDEFKSAEEIKRKNEAEKGLYRQWRAQQPVLRECQRERNLKDLKLSWLDQQIEKRMAKEKEAENLKKFLNEREEAMKRRNVEEEVFKEELKRKQEDLKQGLDKQIREVKEKEEESKRLRAEEEQRQRDLFTFESVKALREEEERRRKDREIALFNLKQYRRKLEARSKDIQEEIEADLQLIQQVQAAELADKLEEAERKSELKESMSVFRDLLRQLKDLEEKRKPYLDFVFEGEAKGVFDTFEKTWQKERQMRNDLFLDVFEGIQDQLKHNLEKNKLRQKELLKEKEELLEVIKRDNEEMKMLREFEEKKCQEFKKDLDEQVKENRMRRRKLEGLEKRRVDDELEGIRNEEERLKKEIAKIQFGKNCPSYGRRRFYY